MLFDESFASVAGGLFAAKCAAIYRLKGAGYGHLDSGDDLWHVVPEDG
jgi:hypothetical protein